MSTLEAINETDNREYNENDFEEISARSYLILKSEHEKCLQEVHDLKRKLELNEAMLREVQETNELVERSLEEQISHSEKIISETKEKQRVTTEEYENIISDLETTLEKQAIEIQRFHQQMNEQKKIECTQAINQLANVSLETDNVSLKKRVDCLTVQLREEKQKCKNAEETIKDLNAQCNQFLHDFRDIKEQLNERSTALEEARAMLASNRMETVSLNLNTNPTSDLSKGNSLFAEIEDRRRDMVNKMNALHRKYAEVKRTCALQMTEIKMLKKERVTTLSEWENNAGNASAEMEELLQKYKSRVSDLERKLKSEIKKNEQSNQDNLESASFAYYQSLLLAKKKEMDELRAKIEHLSTHLLVEEETKINTSKQLRLSQYKISSLEAQIQVLQEELKSSQKKNKANLERQVEQFQGFASVDNDNVKVGKITGVSARQQSNAAYTLRDKNNDDDVVDSSERKRKHKSKLTENVDKDKTTCSAKTVQFSKNIVHIPTDGNI